MSSSHLDLIFILKWQRKYLSSKHVTSLYAFMTKTNSTIATHYLCSASNINSTSNIDVFPPSILSPFLLHYFLASLQYFPSFRYWWFLPRFYWRFPLLFIYWQFSLHLPGRARAASRIYIFWAWRKFDHHIFLICSFSFAPSYFWFPLPLIYR